MDQRTNSFWSDSLVPIFCPELKRVIQPYLGNNNPFFNHLTTIQKIYLEEPKGSLYEILRSYLYPKGYRTLFGKH